MTALFSKPKPPAPPPPVPQVDEAKAGVSRRNRSLAKKGLASTLLTGEGGLPNLGSVSSVAAYQG